MKYPLFLLCDRIIKKMDFEMKIFAIFTVSRELKNWLYNLLFGLQAFGAFLQTSSNRNQILIAT